LWFKIKTMVALKRKRTGTFVRHARTRRNTMPRSRKRRLPAGRGSTKRRAFATAYGPRRAAAYRRRRYGYVSKRTKSLRAKVNELAKAVSLEQGTHLYKKRACGRYEGSPAAVDYYVNPFYTASIKAALANLRYFDPANPGTLVTGVDNTTGTYSRICRIAWVTRSLTLKNSYEVPISLTVYSCFATSDTSTNPETLITNSCVDEVLNGDETSNLIKPFELSQVRAMWRSAGSTKRVLQPGQTMTVRQRIPGFDYKPALEDVQTDFYQKRYNAHTWLLRLEGVIGHDSTLGEYNTLDNAVDYDQRDNIMIHYDAGTAVRDIYVADTASAGFTNVGLTGVRPATDNQAYSVT
jgi:hypothetical protein